MNVWIARDKDGELYMYSHLPILCRNTYFIARSDTNSMKMDRSMFPEVTFEESPKKLRLKLSKMELSRFEKKCLALTIGYDHDVCDGKYCERKLTCLRYMLHKRAEILEDNKMPLSYIFGKPKYNYSICYKKYE